MSRKKNVYQNDVHKSQVAFYLLIPVFMAAAMLFFLGIDHGLDNPIKQLYGFVHWPFCLDNLELCWAFFFFQEAFLASVLFDHGFRICCRSRY
jgi:hypothetical protein